MQVESCRDCSNLEDRRNIDKVALCAMHHGPSVSCPEFKPAQIQGSKEPFCINCVNFDAVGGIPLCARDHRPGVACSAFRAKSNN